MRSEKKHSSKRTTHPSKKSAFDNLQPLMEHRSRFLASLTKWLGDNASAEDILQIGYVHALEHGGPDSEERIIAWFQRLLRNAAIDLLRRKAAEERALIKWAGNEPVTVSLPENLITELCQCILGIASTLPESYQSVLRQIEFNEIPISEVSQRMGISANNVRVRLHRARAALKEKLLITCGICAVHGCLDCWCKKPRRASASGDVSV